MASGGNRRRLPYSEPRNRSFLSNFDDDRLLNGTGTTSGANSTQREDRLNNWDFLDWQPSSTFDTTAKRPKRGNEEREEKRKSGKENNTSEEDSSPFPENRRHRTPSTFPRTKPTSFSSLQERRELENLRQQLTFSDGDEQISTDGMDLGLGGGTTETNERNNERYMPPLRRERPALLERNEVGSNYRRGGGAPVANDNAMRANRTTEPSRDNRNARSNILLAEGEENPDSTHIVGRLMQIRDYIKQSSSMLEKLYSSTTRSDQQKAVQLELVVSRLKEQEQKYLELLLRLSTAKEEELLRRQAGRGDTGAGAALESESEAATELDVGGSDSSDNEAANAESGRPVIEGALGRRSDAEDDDDDEVPEAAELEDTLVAGANELARGSQEMDAVEHRLMLENDLESKSAELEALKQQHELLSKMLQQQEQLRTLQSRQSQLVELQREAERRLEEERANQQQLQPGVASSNSSVTDNQNVPDTQDDDVQDDDEDDQEEEQSGSVAMAASNDVIPQELLELRERLDFLKNIYQISDEQQNEVEEPPSVRAASVQSEDGSVTPTRLLSMDKEQLQGRLRDLQNKKHEMDRLLVELHGMQANAAQRLETEDTGSAQGHAIVASATAHRTEEDAEDMLQVLEARNKMKKLQEVRERLDQLKGLVNYYQSGAEFIHGETDEEPPAPTETLATSVPIGTETQTMDAFTDQAFLQNLRDMAQASVRDILAEEGLSLDPSPVMMRRPLQATEDEVAAARSEATSDTASQLSSALGAWGEDAQIQEKVRRLKEAKEKLHRLQDLVAMVQESPETAQHLPDDLDALAAAMQTSPRDPIAMPLRDVTIPRRGDVTIPRGDDVTMPRDLARRVLAGAGALPGDGGGGSEMGASGDAEERQSLSLRDAVSGLSDEEAALDRVESFYEQKMGQQRQEIDRLMSERQKLLTLQNELQRLHDNMPLRSSTQREIAQQTSPHMRGAPTTVDIAVETLNNHEYRSSGGVPTSPNNRTLANDAGPALQPSPNNRDLARGQQGAGVRQAADGGVVGAQTRQEQRAAQEQRAQEQRDVAVTFQEPLETVISNEVVYGRMRQQRMLREELREKKKELEDMMRKDKPKKQNFSRHQDNQSDNVSFSNRSDPFTDRASQDQTAATWGGSTADNLESIGEDAGDSGDGDEEVDDGYPSDGIVQVEEEEEEANDSDDRDTYTIETDPYPPNRRSSVARSRQVAPTSRATSGGAASARRRTARQDAATRGAPFQGSSGSGAAGVGYNYWAPDNNQVLNNVRSGQRSDVTSGQQRGGRSRQRRANKQMSAVKQELGTIKEQLSVLQEAMQRSNPGMQPSLQQFDSGLTSSLQQQQMMMSFSHMQSSMAAQQQMLDRLARLERSVQASGEQQRHLEASGGSRQAEYNMPHYLDSYSDLYRNAPNENDRNALQQAGFEFQPNFPSGFAQELNPTTEALRNSRNGFYGGRQSGEFMTGEQRVEELLRQAEQSSRAGNPFQIPEYLLCGTPQRATSRGGEREDVAIETIQAMDVDETGDASLSRRSLNSLQQQRNTRSTGARPKQLSGSSSRRSAQQQEQAVRFPTPSRANAAAKLASQRTAAPPFAGGRPGLMSTADDGSVASSVPGREDDALTSQQLRAADREGVEEGGAEFSLFEALRETIYSEVATLISQNETRPHYLIELFRELQLLNTDYLRQRFLYCIQDLVTKYLTEEAVQAEEQRGGNRRSAATQELGAVSGWNGVTMTRVSELTPSASLSTLDDQEVKAKIFRKTSRNSGSNTAVPRAASSTSRDVTEPVNRYDFSEPVETLSSISTPESNHFESPFAQDSLGDTVIHLDQLYDSTFEEYCSKMEALQRMKEYEERLAHSGTQTSPATSQSQLSSSLQPPSYSRLQATARATQTGGVQHPRTSSRETSTLATSEGAMAGLAEGDNMSSSAMDNGSEESVSDIGESTTTSSSSEQTYPRIDTQQLDAQIKGIMTEIIPVLKEHMDDVCSQQLLLYIRRLVLSLTRQRDHDESHEFVRFFHKQLGSILNDSLAKFEGRKMRDCGEDLLVDLSEILFNELAFFRLMQDLDDPKARVKANLRNWHGGATGTSTGTSTSQREGLLMGTELQSDDDDSDTSESTSDDEDQEEGGVTDTTSQMEKQEIEQIVEELAEDTEEEGLESINQDEEEQLGKERDDELAAQTSVTGEKSHPSMKITLAPSETKPMTRIGSDEDTEGDDAEYSNEDPSDTAVSHDYYQYDDDMRDPASSQHNHAPQNQRDRTEEDEENVTEKEAAEGNEKDADTQENVTKETQEDVTKETTESSNASPSSESAPEATVNGENRRCLLETQHFAMYSVPSSSPSSYSSEEQVTVYQVLENGDVEAEEELTIEDLPDKLAGLSQATSKSAEQTDTEAQGGAEAVLEHINSGLNNNELAGDPQAIKDPGSSDTTRQV